MELKELLDMGIISQEEFDTKAKTLKLIVLAPSAADEQHTVLSEKNAEGDFISENGFLKYDGYSEIFLVFITIFCPCKL